jgi:hypothetical protein
MFYCPAYLPHNETELQLVEWGAIGITTPLMPCFTCPTDTTSCEELVGQVLTEAEIGEDEKSTLGGEAIWEEALVYCVELCESNQVGESCNQEDQCTVSVSVVLLFHYLQMTVWHFADHHISSKLSKKPGELFCDYEATDTQLTSGKCRLCPTDPAECFSEGFAETITGQHNCRDCRLYCSSAGSSNVWVNGEHIPSQPIGNAMQSSYQSAEGELYDCSSLILDSSATCEGAEGKLCLIYYEEQFALTFQVSNQAEKSGCIGIVAFLIEDTETPIAHSDDELLIPYVYVTNAHGMNLLNNGIGSTVKVEVNVYGAGCYPGWESNMCSATWPCEEDTYCNFNSAPEGEGDLYTEGYCIP